MFLGGVGQGRKGGCDYACLQGRGFVMVQRLDCVYVAESGIGKRLLLVTDEAYDLSKARLNSKYCYGSKAG